MKGLVSQANVLARIGSLAGLYGVDLSAMQAALGSLGPELARVTVVTISGAFDRIAVSTRVARDRLVDIADRDQLRRLSKLAPDVRNLDVELETSAPLTCTLRAVGSRNVLADCRQFASFGVGTLALDTLRDSAAHLGIPLAITDRAEHGAHEWHLHFGHHNRNDAERATSRAQLLTVARKLGATGPQCNLVDGLHDTLARDNDSYSALVISPENTTLQLAVRWQFVRWETVIRMMLGFDPKSDAGKKLGELSGAFDADQAAAIELLLGPKEPPAIRIAVTFGVS